MPGLQEGPQTCLQEQPMPGEIDMNRDCKDRVRMSFAEAVSIVERSRNEILDEHEMQPLSEDGYYKLGISPDADVLIHDNWHRFHEESAPEYVYGLYMARGFEVLLMGMDIDAIGSDGIVMGSRCGHVRVSSDTHVPQTVPDADPDDVSELVRAVHGSRLDTIEPGTRFDVGYGIRLEVVRLLGSDHWSDIVLRADFDDGGGISFAMYGIPIPEHDCIVLTLGCSSLRIPLPEDVVKAESFASGKGAEATRRYLAEHPVQEDLLEGLGDGRPDPSNPTRVGIWYRGDEREYPFPMVFQRYEPWWGSPLCLMSPDNSEEDNGVFSNRYFSWDDPDTLESQSECLKPNFLFKPTGFEVTWYKHPFRSMWMNQDLSPREIMHMMALCEKLSGVQRSG